MEMKEYVYGDAMRIRIILISLVACLLLTGCVEEQVYSSNLEFLNSGFDPQHDNVFLNWRHSDTKDRFRVLLDDCGFTDFEYDPWPIRTPGDGRILIIPSETRTDYIVFTTDSQPRLYTFPESTRANDSHAVVATKEYTPNGSYWKFTDGSKYDIGPLEFDDSHRFFMSGKELGKSYWDLPYLFRVSEPSKSLGKPVTDPRKIYSDDNTLYLVSGGHKKEYPATCEIIDVSDGNFNTIEVVEIPVPRVWAASHLFPEDFDAVSKQILFRLVKHDKFTPRPQYIYDLNTRQLEKFSDGRNSDGIFLQRDFFDRLYETLGIEEE